MLTGPSGSGKSDLALRCIGSRHRWGDRVLEARLVADDRIILERRDARIAARCPEAIAGRLEVRGHGIVEAPSVPEAWLELVVELVGAGAIERLPEHNQRTQILGLDIPALRVAPFEASAPLKILLRLAGYGPGP